MIIDIEDAKLFRRFKRQYQLVKKNYLSTKPTTIFELKYEAETGGTSQFTMTDETASARFWNLMRPFLNERSALCFRNIWNLIKSKYSNHVELDLNGQIEIAIADIDVGLPYFKNQDGKRFCPEEIYQWISASGYFFLDEEKKASFERLSQTPLMRQLLWFAFDNYHHATYLLISLMLKAIWSIDDQPAEKIDGPCIYCLRTDVSFSSEEHIYPESLGNDDAVLRKGIVCDKCNNRFSGLDKYLIDFAPIALLRTMNVPFTKKGKFPQAEFQEVNFRKIHPTLIKIDNKSDKSVIQETERFGDGNIKFRGQLTSKDPLDGRKLGRALYKIGLGMLALHNLERAQSPLYQAARDFILHDKPFNNTLLILRSGKPTTMVRTHIQFIPEGGTIVGIDIWGVVFSFNLEAQTRVAIPEQFKDDLLEIPLWE